MTDKKNKITLPIIISIASLVLAFAAVVISLVPYRSKSEPLKPSGYAILRGYTNYFPSDHIMLPMQWETRGIKDVLLRNPILTIEDITEGIDNPVTIKYTAAGELPGVSNEDFLDTRQLDYGNSFVLDGNTISKKNILFHYERWYDGPDENDPTKEIDKYYEFQFQTDRTYKVTLRYQINTKEAEEVELFYLKTYSRIGDLKLYSDDPDSWWDYFYMD